MLPIGDQRERCECCGHFLGPEHEAAKARRQEVHDGLVEALRSIQGKIRTMGGSTDIAECSPHMIVQQLSAVYSVAAGALAARGGD